MPLPLNITMVTVEGTYVDMSGAPLSGTVTFVASVSRLRNPDGDVVVTDFPFTVILDGTGSFSVQLPATDDPDWVPSPWSYKVTENLNDHRDSFFMEVPASTPGGVLRMDDVDRAVKVPPVITYAGRREFLDHLDDTVDVHGIANTALLETKSGAQAKANGALTAAVNAISSAISSATSSILTTVAGIYTRKDRLAVNLKDYAVGDGVTNDSVAVQDAINAVPDGGTLYVPKGSYLVGPSSVGTDANAIFTRANGQRINIVGEGFESLFKVHASTPSTMDVLKFNWTTSARGMRFENFGIMPASGNPGRHGIMFNLTSGTTVLTYQVIFRNLLIFLNNATGKSICVDVNVASVSGGMAYSVIEECLLDGIRLVNVGDNIKVSHNTMIPTNAATPTVYVVNINGAKNFDFVHNVVAGLNTMLLHDGGYSSVIDGNWFETPATIPGTYPNGAMLDLHGGSSIVKHAKVRNNAFMSHIGTNLPNPIRVNNAQQTLIDGNFVSTYSFPHYDGIKITASALDTIVGPNTYEEGGTLKYQDDCVNNLGTRTVFTMESKKTFTPAISFGGGTTGIGYNASTAGTAVKIGRTVTFSLVISLNNKGSSTGNLAVGTLPWAAERDSPVALQVQTVTSGVGDTNLSAYVVGGFGSISVRKMVSGTDTTLTDADLTNGSTLRISGSYVTAN